MMKLRTLKVQLHESVETLPNILNFEERYKKYNVELKGRQYTTEKSQDVIWRD